MDYDQKRNITKSDFATICRICLSVKKDMEFIHNTFIPKMLKAFTTVQVEENDDLPSRVCLLCMEQIKNTYHFKNQCENSDMFLRQILTQPEAPSVKLEIDIKPDMVSEIMVDSVTTEEKPFEKIKIEQQNEQFDDSHDSFSDLNDEVSKSGSVERGMSPEVRKLSQIPCDNCNTDSQKSQNLTFSCPVCNKIYTRQSDVKRHMLRHEGNKRYACEHCNKRFYELNALALHVNKVHGTVSPIACEICKKEFWVKEQLDMHMKTHTKKTPVPLKCNICEKMFTLPYKLRNHMRAHTGERKYQCKLCDKAFKYPSNLTQHVDFVHHQKKPPGPRPQYRTIQSAPKQKDKLMCNVCGKSVVHLKQHMLHKHSGVRAFKCEECEMVFARKASLDIHVRKKHKGEDMYTDLCSMCGKRFLSVTALRFHMRTHTKERPCKCDVCGKGFVTPGHLRIHVRSHTGERPYKCTICEKAFITSTMLKDHLRVHTGERPFACTLCDRAFSQRKTLKAHMMNAH